MRNHRRYIIYSLIIVIILLQVPALFSNEPEHHPAVLLPQPQSIQFADKLCILTMPVWICGNSSDIRIENVMREVGKFLSDEYALQPVYDHHFAFSQQLNGIIVADLYDPAVQAYCQNLLVEHDQMLVQPEGYVLLAENGSIILASSTEQGLFNGLQTLKQLLIYKDKNLVIPETKIVDWPDKAFRGFHMYIPGRENIPFYKKWIDCLAALKFNTLFIEVGAGMEYKKHPEINTAWEKFVQQAYDYSGGVWAMVDAQGRFSDSVHPWIGGGSFLTQEEVKDLIRYARSRHMEVIPEVQTMTHSYYLLNAHRELAEFQRVRFPDTYCPSNPETYELLFDVIDEVIEVFQPKTMHVGRDELVFLNVCERCRARGIPGYQIFAEDIIKIHDYLQDRGIRMMMWGDNYQNFIRDGKKWRYRGIGPEYHSDVMDTTIVVSDPDSSVYLVPKDILILDWIWAADTLSEQYFHNHGFETVVGNFHYFSEYTNWAKRSASDKVLGAEVSAWTNTAEYTYGRDELLEMCMLASEMQWTHGYKDSQMPQTREKMRELLPVFRDRISDVKSPARTVHSLSSIDLTTYYNSPLVHKDHYDFSEVPAGNLTVEGYRIQIGSLSGQKQGIIALGPAQKEVQNIPVNRRIKSVVFQHATSVKRPFQYTWREHWLPRNIIGYYRIIYEDRSVELIPIDLYYNIAPHDMKWSEAKGTFCYFADMIWQGRSTNGTNIALYAYEWINPHPDKKVSVIDCHFAGDDDGGQLFVFNIAVVE